MARGPGGRRRREGRTMVDPSELMGLRPRPGPRSEGVLARFLVVCVAVGEYAEGVAPDPGSELHDCARCPRDIWVSPRALAEVARAPCPATLVCTHCVTARER